MQRNYSGSFRKEKAKIHKRDQREKKRQKREKLQAGAGEGYLTAEVQRTQRKDAAIPPSNRAE
jgi:hypothetical protein